MCGQREPGEFEFRREPPCRAPAAHVRGILGRAYRRGREAERVVARDAFACEHRLDLREQREQLVASRWSPRLRDAETVERSDAYERLGGGQLCPRAAEEVGEVPEGPHRLFAL